MAFSLIAYPNLIYRQSTEPADKTAGRLWVNSDDNMLYIANGTTYNSLSASPYLEKYASTDLNVDNLATAGTYTSSHEFTAVASSTKTYIRATIRGYWDGIKHTSAGRYNTLNMKVQIKETGGAYGDIEAYQVIENVMAGSVNTEDILVKKEVCYVVTYALTAGMKSNGYQLKAFTQCVSSHSGKQCNFTLREATIEEI